MHVAVQGLVMLANLLAEWVTVLVHLIGSCVGPLSSLSYGLHAHTMLFEMENRHQHGRVSNRTCREAHLITTWRKREALGVGWLGVAAF